MACASSESILKLIPFGFRYTLKPHAPKKNNNDYNSTSQAAHLKLLVRSLYALPQSGLDLIFGWISALYACDYVPSNLIKTEWEGTHKMEKWCIYTITHSLKEDGEKSGSDGKINVKWERQNLIFITFSSSSNTHTACKGHILNNEIVFIMDFFDCWNSPFHSCTCTLGLYKFSGGSKIKHYIKMHRSLFVVLRFVTQKTYAFLKHKHSVVFIIIPVCITVCIRRKFSETFQIIIRLLLCLWVRLFIWAAQSTKRKYEIAEHCKNCFFWWKKWTQSQ